MIDSTPGVPGGDITTEFGVVRRLPTTSRIDADVDDDFDLDLFQAGFGDANVRLRTFPPSWARHHATTVMQSEPLVDDDAPSYTRGYRAAAYGYLRHCLD
ncbi:hypothetical protein nbrc107696_36040 [Gordonia spumicola]|uniref:Uncharacterized protein n=1 Tax=Gordonia spumicola TaxID=589161 RepID=A0A7I9VCR3_9ACTN|nr:hypothetical protein [Gordonia spumicola]GEE03158.1 hypothetical protein nbrc107696_36040 [Gordonia spumicola]